VKIRYFGSSSFELLS